MNINNIARVLIGTAVLFSIGIGAVFADVSSPSYTPPSLTIPPPTSSTTTDTAPPPSALRAHAPPPSVQGAPAPPPSSTLLPNAPTKLRRTPPEPLDTIFPFAEYIGGGHEHLIGVPDPDPIWPVQGALWKTAPILKKARIK